MDHGLVQTHGVALIQRQLLEALNGIGITVAQCQMAGGVLVKEGVVEQQLCVADGAVVGYQRALAQIGAALIHGDELGQQLTVHLGVPLHGLTLVEADPELVDELALIAQRHGGVDDTLSIALLGGDEALLRGDVGVEGIALQALLAGTAETAALHETHGKVGAVGRSVVQLPDAEGVEVVALFVDFPVVLVPCGNGVIGDAGSVEDILPQLLHRLRGAEVGEELLGPRLAGDGGDTPLVFVLHGLTEGLGDGIAVLLCLGHLGLVDAPEAVGILGDEIDAAGQLVHIVLPAGDLVILHLAEGLEAAVAVVELLQGLIVPLQHHLLGLAAVTLLHHHGHELRLVQIGGDEHFLSGLNVDAHLCDELGILAQNGLFHRGFSLFAK